jgi:hypothetical protein
MRLRVLLAVGAMFTAGLAVVGLGATPAGAAATLVAGPNVNATKTAGNQNEAGIAADPNNAQHLFFAANTDASAFPDGLRAGVSSDGGATWTTRAFADGSTDTLTTACCDPKSSWDTFGNLFVTYLDSTLNHAIVALSTDSGATFTQIASIAADDQPSITTGANSVWITFKNGSNVQAAGAAVTGLGTVGAFGASESAPGSSSSNFGDIAISPTGAVYVVYEKPSGGQGPATIFGNFDSDGLGAGGFGSQITVTSTNVGGFDFIPAQPDRSVDAEANLAWDRTGGAHNGRLYVAYTDEQPDESNDTNVFLRFSDDNGSNWSAPVRANDDAGTNSQFNPAIALDQSTGNVGLTWLDARNDTGSGSGDTDGVANDDAQLWGTVSTDNGASFLPNVQISAGTSHQNNLPGPGFADIDFGDYNTATYAGGVLYGAWADNSNSTGDNPQGALKQMDVYVAAVTFQLDTTLTYTGATTSDFNDAATVSANLKDSNNNPVPNETVTFTLNGTETCNGTTNTSGDASCPITPGEAAGSYTLTAVFAGDSHFKASNASTTFVVTKEETTTTVTGSNLFANGMPATLSGVLLEDDVTAISGRMLTLTLGSGITAQSCMGTTDGTGQATCPITSVNQPLGPGTETASFAGDAFYLPSSQTVSTINFQYTAGGSFVLGDKAVGPIGSAIGKSVTFWGAQWPKVNGLSGGDAPSSFKGFANHPTLPSVGVSWTTGPGDSPPPAGSVPAYTAMIVASSVTKSGSTIGGNDVHIVIVQVNPGYAPNPSSTGTGTIVAVLA